MSADSLLNSVLSGGGGGSGRKVMFALGAVAAAAAYALAQHSQRDRARQERHKEEWARLRSVHRRESFENMVTHGADHLLSKEAQTAGAGSAASEAALLQMLQTAPFVPNQLPRGFEDLRATYESSSLSALPQLAGHPALAYHIFTFLEPQDVARLRGVSAKFRDFLQPLLTDHHYLKACAKRGFDERVRGMCWFLASQTPPPAAKKRAMYRRLLEQKSHCAEEIERDCTRTLIHYRSFESEQEAVSTLTRLLHAYSVHEPEVGYTQGMNFVAAFFLTKLSDEEQAYWLLYTLFVSSRLQLRSLYTRGLPGLKLRQYQFQRLLEFYLPRLTSHLDRVHVSCDMFVTEWFMTLFTYRAIPPETSARIWDRFLVEGWKVLHRVALAILAISEETLLDQDFEGAIQYLKFFPDQGIFQPEVLLARADQFKVTNRLLHKLSLQFYQPASQPQANR